MGSPGSDAFPHEPTLGGESAAYLPGNLLHDGEQTCRNKPYDGIDISQGIHCTRPSQSSGQILTELNDVDDAKLWPPNIERLFIQLMVEEMIKGNMQEGIFQRGIWEKISVKLNELTNRNFKIAQLKTKFNRLRQRHRIFSQLLQHPELGWDVETNTVSATDEVWKNVLAAMPKAKEFRRKGCENYIQLGRLFNKTITTGVMAFASTQDPTNANEERELDERYISSGMHVDVDVEAEIDFDIQDDDVHPIQGDLKETPPAKRPRSGTLSKGKKLGTKGGRFSEMTEAINNFAPITERRIGAWDARNASKYGATIANSSASSAMKCTPPTNDYSLERAIQLLNTYKGLSEERLMKILQALYEETHRIVFLSLDEEKRDMWMNFMAKQ